MIPGPAGYFVHLVRGRPGGLLQFSKGDAVNKGYATKNTETDGESRTKDVIVVDVKVVGCHA